MMFIKKVFFILVSNPREFMYLTFLKLFEFVHVVRSIVDCLILIMCHQGVVQRLTVDLEEGLGAEISPDAKSVHDFFFCFETTSSFLHLTSIVRVTFLLKKRWGLWHFKAANVGV